MDTLSLITPPDSELRLPREPVRAIGIDLGTTNSTIAEVLWEPNSSEPAKVRCILIPQGRTPINTLDPKLGFPIPIPTLLAIQ